MRFALLVAALALALAALAGQERASARTDAEYVPHSIQKARGDTWRCQDTAGLGRTRASRWLPPSADYRLWVLDLWRGRARECKTRFGRYALLDRDVHRAGEYAARLFGVSWQWLHDCMHAEGGHVSSSRLRVALATGSGVGWNTQGSYAFGNWQFMLSRRPPSGPAEWGTFGRMAGWAWSGKARHVPGRYRNPASVLGQALAAAAGFAAGRSSEWSGSGC